MKQAAALVKDSHPCFILHNGKVRQLPKFNAHFSPAHQIGNIFGLKHKTIASVCLAGQYWDIEFGCHPSLKYVACPAEGGRLFNS